MAGDSAKLLTLLVLSSKHGTWCEGELPPSPLGASYAGLEVSVRDGPIG